MRVTTESGAGPALPNRPSEEEEADMRSSRIGGALVLAACMAAVALAACGGSSGGSSGATKKPTGPVTLTWWHNGTTDPLKKVWEGVAADFHRANPKVTIKIEPIQNEQFQTKMPLALRSSNPPDIYQQWGGGSQASQLRSGKVMD